MKLSEAQIDKIFEEAKDQSDYIVGIYRLVFPDWDDIEAVNGWPTISKKTSEYIFDKAMEFDAKHHPDVIMGGMWMNNGFSTLDGEHLALWEVDITTAKVTYKQEKEKKNGN